MRLSLCRLVILITLFLGALNINAQDRFISIERGLKNLAVNSKGLNEKVELSVNEVTMQEFVRALAIAHDLNISVDPGLRSVSIINNFSKVSVSEVLVFLCKQYELEIEFIGSIMSIKRYVAPPPEAEPYVRKKLKISYNDKNDFLSLDLRKDSLQSVVREITRITGHNVIASPKLEGKIVGIFIQNRPFDETLEKFAMANDLVLTESDNFYYFENVESVSSSSSSSRRSKGKSQGNKGTGELDISVRDDAFITVSAKDVPIADLIAGVSAELFKQYFIFSDPEGTTSLYIENATYEDFLSYVLNGTNFTFKSDDGVYLIGERKLERLRTTELVQLQYRTVESVLEFIPPELKKDVNIQEFTDLNSLILSGSHPKIREIKSFLKDVDKLVPVVMIEVIIIDVRNTVSLATGIKAGLGESPVETSGTVFPGLDVTLSSAAINKVIDGINGFGIVNLGKVTPIFYLTLQALETQGSINVRSTPQLATLNGHEANMSIGETRFYLETSTTLQGSVSTTSTVSQTYKSVNADLSIKINPIVSGDEQVTLEIDVKQSSFGERISNEAPYGTITRNFQSLIRVKNEEMIILGGLEDKTISDSGSGVPFLSRIPIIKWFFSSRSKSTGKNKLTIFIKPTIIY